MSYADFLTRKKRGHYMTFHGDPARQDQWRRELPLRFVTHTQVEREDVRQLSVQTYDETQLAAVLTPCATCARSYYMTRPQPVCVLCRRQR